jgi:hypothetical protein
VKNMSSHKKVGLKINYEQDKLKNSEVKELF